MFECALDCVKIRVKIRVCACGGQVWGHRVLRVCEVRSVFVTCPLTHSSVYPCIHQSNHPTIIGVQASTFDFMSASGDTGNIDNANSTGDAFGLGIGDGTYVYLTYSYHAQYEIYQ